MNPALHLPLLTRVLTQPWAIREASLVALTQMLIGGQSAEPRLHTLPREGMATPDLRPRADTSWNIPQWNDAGGIDWKPLQTSPGYTAFSVEAVLTDRRGNLPPVPEGVSVFLIWGVLGRGWTMEDRWYLDPVEVDEIITALAKAPEGSTVVFWFRSPGGIVTGIPEAAAEIRRVKKARSLRVLGFCDDLVASAAYWLAAMCDQIIATPTAEAGSIGVYLAFYDFVEYLAKAGVKLELFKVGALKGIGVVGNPLDDPAREYLLSGVVEARRQFVRDVTNFRALEDATMQGQTLQGKAAKAANLVDSFQPSASAFFEALGRGRI